MWGTYLLLLCLGWLLNHVSGEIVSIDSSGEWSCSSSSSQCRMIVDSECGNTPTDCSGSEYHCPNSPDSCELCELYCDGSIAACKHGTFYSYFCKQVNIIANTTYTDQIFRGRKLMNTFSSCFFCFVFFAFSFSGFIFVICNWYVLSLRSCCYLSSFCCCVGRFFFFVSRFS